MSYLFFLPKIANKMCYKVLISTVDNVINFLDQPLRQWLTERKRGEDGNTKIQKFGYLKNENSFLEEIKNIFHLS